MDRDRSWNEPSAKVAEGPQPLSSLNLGLAELVNEARAHSKLPPELRDKLTNYAVNSSLRAHPEVVEVLGRDCGWNHRAMD